MWVNEYVKVTCLGSSEDGSRSPGAGNTGGSELPRISAGHLTRVYGKGSKFSYLLIHLPSPLLPLEKWLTLPKIRAKTVNMLKRFPL